VTGPGLPTFEYALLLIPGFIILFLLGVILLVLYWRNRTQEDLKDLRPQMRSIEADLKQFNQEAQAFSPSDPEPFGSLAKNLVQKIEDTYQSVLQMQARYTGLMEDYHTNLVWNWRSVPQSPAVWFRIRQKVTDLKKSLEKIRDQLQIARDSYQKIRAQGWETAGAVRQVQQDLIQASQGIQQLREWNIQGEAFEAATRQKSILLVALSDIPEYFLQADEKGVLDHADKDSVVRVYRMLSENRQQVSALSNKIKGWQDQYQDSSNGLAQLRGSVVEIQNQLSGMPPELVVDSFRDKLRQLIDIGKDLAGRLARPDPEGLTAIAREARRSHRIAQDLQRQIDRVHQQWKALAQGIPDLSRVLNDLQNRFRQLASAQKYPVDWDQSYPKLTALLSQFAEIRSDKDPREPDQVDQDLALLGQITQGYQDLSQRHHQVATWHAELTSILEGLDLQQSLQWTQEAKRLVEQALAYDPENWPRKVSVQALADNLGPLEKQMRDLESRLQAHPVKETELEEIIAQLHQVTQQIQVSRDQEQLVRRRFEEIQALETETHDILAAARMSLAQIQRISRANEYLEQMAQGQVDRLMAEADHIMSGLDQRAQGTVAKKNSQVNSFVRTAEQNANQWFQSLNQDVLARQSIIVTRLNDLNEIAAIDEPVIQDAHKFISTQPVPTPGDRRSAGKKTLYPLGEIPLQFKYRNEDWQRCVAFQAAIEEVEKPILDAADQANAQREAARALLVQAKTLVPDGRAWPPSTLSLASELREFNDIENQWDALQKTSNRAIWLVSKLSDLAHRYMVLTDRTRQIVDRASGEQARVRDLEHQMNGSVQLWRAQLKAYANHEMARQEIQRLIGESNEGLEALKQEYLQEIKNYNQVVQDLILLSRRLNNALVPLDEDHAIDINGENRVNYSR